MKNIDVEWEQKKNQFFKLWPLNKHNEIENIWEMLTRHYSEPTRFYHTREHILECLKHYDQIKDNLSSANAVQLSIWFHDVIYDIKAKDNEEQSAIFFSQISEGILTDKIIQMVADLIVSTKHLTSPPNCDQAFLLDIDLSSFGSELEIFYLNGENLRKETPHLTDKQYIDKQLIFFQMLLNRKQIFFTDYFYDKYETIARNNINHQMQEILNTD